MSLHKNLVSLVYIQQKLNKVEFLNDKIEKTIEAIHEKHINGKANTNNKDAL